MRTSFISFTMYVFYDCMTREPHPDSFVSIEYISIYLLIIIWIICIRPEADIIDNYFSGPFYWHGLIFNPGMDK